MKPGVLVISHGSRDADWVALVDEAVDSVRRPAGMPVVSSFLEIVEGRLIQDGVDALEADGVTHIYVLPLFVSSGSTHVDDIAQAFGQPAAAYREGELEPFTVREASVTVGRPIDDDPVIAEIVYGNVRELSVAPERETLLLVAHGSREKGLNRVWRTGMTRLAERVRALGGFKRAEIATLLPDQAACVMKALTRRRAGVGADSGDGGEAVLVAPLFLSRGYFTNTVIPGRLAGFDYRYNGRALLPNPYISRWIERQIGEWLTDIEAR
ncbi:MAG TPA: CbiX/SirB N-terminal domain-containing protein [Paenibacillus sp.]|uniref:sirohydrochlorin chelatase n=1 Tax=Paenibacillus sp. TaxID=58172 RepID=UPI002C980FF8|nr:CbiX/SirB N-terminal domain-containing protein [Paenibacillus sp.]HUC90807.1 CbiX/SirB N-terminal domain-containing protein [Paenibacillus sp.]